MSYSISLASINAVRVYLETLLASPGKDISISCLHEPPTNLAFKLRQAFIAAEQLNEPPFNLFRRQYKVRPKRDRVICEWQDSFDITVTQQIQTKERFYPDITTEQELLQTIVLDRDKFDVLQFPLISYTARVTLMCTNFKLQIETKQHPTLQLDIIEITHAKESSEKSSD